MPELSTTLTDEQKVKMNIISLNTAVNDLQQETKDLQKILVLGNGELPLRERVRNLETFTNSIKFWMRTIAVAIILQTITFGAAALIYFIRLYPILNELARKP